MPGVKERPRNPNCQISIGACRGAEPQLRAVSSWLMVSGRAGFWGLKPDLDFVSDPVI